MTFYFKITTHLCLIPNDKALLKMKIALHVAWRIEEESNIVVCNRSGKKNVTHFFEGIVGLQQPHLLTL